MPLNVVCPDCGYAHRVKDQYAGRRIKCKGCDSVLQVPDALDEGFAVDDEFSEDGFRQSETEEDYGIPASVLKRRKTRKRRSNRVEPVSQPMFVNRLQLAVLVMVLIMATRYGITSFWPVVPFGTGGFLQVISILSGVASLLAYIAMIIGGIGIFQRDPRGAPLTQVAAWVKLAIAVIGMATGAIAAVQSEVLARIIIARLSTSAVFGVGIPIGIIFCIRHPSWDTPDET